MKCKWLSKLADKKLRKLGFKLEKENQYGVTYQRYNEVYEFMHVVSIRHNVSGKHCIQSYVAGDANTSKHFNDSVALSGTETKWLLIKMISIGLYSTGTTVCSMDDVKEADCI